VSSHLEFDHVNVGDDPSEASVLHDVVEQGLQLELEDSCDDVASVGGVLFLASLNNLWPVGVAGEGDEEVGLAMLSDDGHRVLIELLHVSFSSNKARRQHHSSTVMLCRQSPVSLCGLDDSVQLLWNHAESFVASAWMLCDLFSPGKLQL